MVSSKRKRFDFRLLLVAVLCLAGAGTGAYWLYLDFYQSAGEGLGAPMAQIERREAKVRRKPSRSFAWNNAQQDEKLFRRDSVQTSVGSAASIRFTDGTLLELGENSLVVIEDVQKLSLDFMKGAVVLHTAAGDRRVTTGSDGKAKIEEVPIRLLKPEPLARYFTLAKENRTIRFAWKARAGQEAALPAGLALQISPDRGFERARIRELPVQDPGKLESQASLGEGLYFWRLAAAGKPLTEAAQFRVIAASPLQPVSPGGSEMLHVFGDETATQFKWAAPEEAASQGQVVHEIQVSRAADFSSVALHQEISASSGAATLRNLPAGVLYWRIRSQYGDLQLESRSERFAMLKEQRPEIVLNLPEDQKTVERLPSTHFSWKSDAQGLEYELVVQALKGSQETSQPPVRTHATSALVKGLESGQYRWRVTAYQGKTAVSETAWRGFSVFEGARFALRSPPNGRELYSWDKAVSFDFEWDQDVWVESHPEYSYQVAVSRDADFKAPKLGPKTRETSVPSAKLELASGPSLWKVLVVDAAGQTIKSSDVWRFAYGLPPELKAPVGVAPARQSIFNLVDKAENPSVSWKEVSDAEAYELTLYAVDAGTGTDRAVASAGPDGAPPGGRVVFRTVTSKTEFELKGLEPAQYVWTVRALDRGKRKGQAMQPWPFAVTYGELLSAPKIISPEVQ